jgi:hypothetical protein
MNITGKLTIFTFAALLLAACGGSQEEAQEPQQEKEKPVFKGTLEERARHEVEAALQIPANEKYTMKCYREHLNDDGIEDMIVTVNRLEFAQNEAIRTGREAKAAEVGFMGYYNFFFYYDGKLDRFSIPLKIPSTPGRPLDISFDYVTTTNKKDLIVEHRIMDSGYKSYYTVAGDHELLLAFQWPYFDLSSETQPHGQEHVLANDRSPISKDIFIYDSEVKNEAEAEKDEYAFVPQFGKRKKLLYHFFYDPANYKYRLLPQ